MRPAREQILVPVFQTSVLHVLEGAHYFLAAQNVFFKKKKEKNPPDSGARGHIVTSALFVASQSLGAENTFVGT